MSGQSELDALVARVFSSSPDEASQATAQVLVRWAQVSQDLERVLRDASVLTPDERALVILAIRTWLDSPAPSTGPFSYSGLNLTDRAYSLLERLLRDCEAHALDPEVSDER